MRPIAILILLCCILSCSKKELSPTKKKQQATKSEQQADIRLAILPTIDCLPFAVAKERGIYDSIGLNVKIYLYPSQLNAEKALEQHKIDACASDLFRIAMMQSRKIPVKMSFSTNREWHLVANKSLRITQAKQLGGRIVATTRHSVADHICENAASQANKTKGPTLKAQINSIYIRESMLLAAQVDAAVLPQPFAMSAERKGHTCLYKSELKGPSYAGIAVLSQSNLREKLMLLRKGYDLAAKQLQEQNRINLSEEMERQFALTELKDSIKPRSAFRLSLTTTQENAKQAVQWLKSQSILSASYTSDTLLYK